MNRGLVLSIACLAAAGVAATRAVRDGDRSNGHSEEPNPADATIPASPRDFFNEGTRKLEQTNFWRAEYNLEQVLQSQDERLQSPALYNLGHVRFGQGLEELKKGPPGGRTTSAGRTAAEHADEALRALNEALAASDDAPSQQPPATAAPSADETLQKLINSYI